MYGEPGKFALAVGQLPAPAPKFPVQPHTEDDPFTEMYGAFFHVPEPSLTTKDCLAGILKYLLKSY